MLKSAVQAVLLASSAVTDIVGAGNAARIYYLHLPQKAVLPAITLRGVSGPRENTLQGYNCRGESRVQVDCWGKQAGDAAVLTEAVIECLAGYKGIARGIFFEEVTVSNSTDRYEHATKEYGTATDFIIKWRTLPS